jgi:maltose O-acetyltransferase
MGEHKDNMLSGELYWYDAPELIDERARCAELVTRYNAAPVTQHGALLRELFGHVGEGAVVNAPLRCDYGYRVSIGAGSFINYDAVLLDSGGITIGDHVQMGPRVQLLTPVHPLDPDERREPVERGLPIVIGDDVWLAGGVLVCPGVTIGAGTVVGAGSVVTRDLPDRALAVGNPCRVIRAL